MLIRNLSCGALLVILGCNSNVPPEENHKLIILFGGDVMFDRGVRMVASNSGYDRILQDLATLSEGSDAFVVNFETPVSEESTPILKKFVFNSDTACVSAMKRAGITHLNLANNHSIDHGKPGLEATLRNVVKKGLIYTGAGNGFESACSPMVIKKGNIRVAIFSSVLLPLERWYNTDNTPCICTESAEELAVRIDNWLEYHPHDIVILQLHWGVEYRLHPELHQLKDAEVLISAGARLILGHHPHVVQEIRYLDGVPVVFSLGNLVFDNPRDETNKTGLLKVVVDSDANLAIQFFPMRIDKCMPIKMKASDSEAFILELSKRSRVKFIPDDEWYSISQELPQ